MNEFQIHSDHNEFPSHWEHIQFQTHLEHSSKLTQNTKIHSQLTQNIDEFQSHSEHE